MTQIKNDYVAIFWLIGFLGPVSFGIQQFLGAGNMFFAILSYPIWIGFIALILSWIMRSWNFICEIKITDVIQRKNICGAVLALLVGIGFIVASVTWAINIHDFISKAKTADGVVVVTEHASWHPRVEYTSASGEKRWFLTNDGVSGYRIFNYKDGKHVKVLYNPANPARNHIDDFIYSYSVPVIGGIIGLVFLAVAYVVLFGTIVLQVKDDVSAIACLSAGIIFLIIAVMCAQNSCEYISKTKVAEGVVIAMPYGGNSHADIKYINAKGEDDSLHANGLIVGYKAGDRVRVLYDPANPRKDDIDDFGSLYAASYSTIFFGIVSIVIGLQSLFGLVEWK